ncbi:MAG TPA: phosphoadenylyl-sulfate reductase, partial [Myxococcota bacterium]|nr:phosphoadenylyl-sulfate reductase [Myxococcota bacterium]
MLYSLNFSQLGVGYLTMALGSVAESPRNRLEIGVLEFIGSGAAESMDAREILTWGVENFRDRIALSCSFGAPEGLVLLDMLHGIDPRARVFVLDTGRLPQATYDLIDRVRDRYEVEVEVIFPDAERVQGMVREHGLNLFYESVAKRELCCRVRKVEPLNRYLAGLDAWVTGLRREHSRAREQTPKLEIDRAHGGIAKLNPLADWSRERVLDYVRDRHVPINRLHAEGYPSVGCEPCSRAIG